MSGYRPHHQRIEDALRERIAGARPGDRLPSDGELQVAFGVSRMTARQAMQRLVDEGLVSREPGRGSFVASPPAHRRSDRLMTFSQEMRRRGRRPSSRIISCGLRPSTAADRAALGIAPADAVLEVRRLRLADSIPIALERAVLIAECATVVLSADLEDGSLHEALVSGGWVPRRGTGTIEAAAASVDDGAWLDVPVGSPLLVERRVIVADDGRPIEATESRYPADRYALDVRFEVEGSGHRAGTPDRGRA